MTNTCQHWEEDLALLAGGDLPSVDRESEVLAHVGDCAACADLLAALGADQALLGAARAVGAPAELGLADAVLESLERTVEPRRAAAGRRGLLGSVTGWAAAAAAVLVATVAIVQTPVEQRDSDTGNTLQPPLVAADDRGEVPLAVPDGLPVQVHRVAGQGVELTWAGDGREGRAQTVPYRVLASASPRDFTGAQSIEVAGETLVATARLPAARMTDRKVTYFRVQ